MLAKHIQLKHILLLSAAALSFNTIACVGEDDGNEGTTENNAATAEESTEYMEAVPTAEMLSVSNGSEGLRLQALTPEQEEEDGPASELRDHIANVRSGVQDVVERTHASIDKVMAEGTVVATVNDERQCRVWDYEGQRASWRLLVCREQQELENVDGKAFGWVAFARPLGSMDNQEFDPVAAGVGAKLMREDGKRGGAGRVYYNLDNYAKHTGEDVSGKLGIGYRAAGKARQMVLGLKDFKPRNATDTRDSLYRYTHLIGRGGRFVFLTHHDLLTRDADGGLTIGKDMDKEYGRAVAAWNTNGKARVTMTACGGTVGQGSCAHLRQCFETDGPVTFEQVTAEESMLDWEATSCGATPLPADAAPAEAEVMLEGSTEEMTIPEPAEESEMM